MNKKLKVLLVIEQCNPDGSSVPLVSYNFYQEISKIVETTLVTHIRNQSALQKKHPEREIVYINEGELSKKYYSLISKLTAKGRVNWPLQLALAYPIYAEFNHQVYQQFKDKVATGCYDIVHIITPMMPRYPVKLIKVCKNTPFLLGPVNGGVPFPPGFQDVAKKEYAQFNFLRAIGRYLIPGYRETYKKADKILAGSTFTLNMLKQLFNLPNSQINLFYENGIHEDLLSVSKDIRNLNKTVNLLFVGRLVPYKGADMLIEAVNNLINLDKYKLSLTIVGDGSEKDFLENKVKLFNLQEIVKFTGWVNQQETQEYYQQADIFCFPSIREFGGAVVLEAMAFGLPCIVVNNGGIGEYVTAETGFKIEPISREYLIQELAEKIIFLIENEALYREMSIKARERVREFTWTNKAKEITIFYEELIKTKSSVLTKSK